MIIYLLYKNSCLYETDREVAMQKQVEKDIADNANSQEFTEEPQSTESKPAEQTELPPFMQAE